MDAFHTIIIGSGASGLMCARSVPENEPLLIIDHAADIGSKIAISGGGKCNFSNLKASADTYLCGNPHFVKSALSRFTPEHFIQLLNNHRIAWEEREKGQLFAFDAGQIVDMLYAECTKPHIHFSMNTEVIEVKKEKDIFIVTTSKGIKTCRTLVIATGGLSIPALGASDFGYKIAKQFGHRIVPPRPALAGFVFQAPLRAQLVDLAGVSVPVRVRFGKKEITGDMLFTHVGVSGPAILNASLYWESGQPVRIQFVGEKELDEALMMAKKGKQTVISAVIKAGLLPSRLAKTFLADVDFDVGNLNKTQKALVIERLTNWCFTPLKTVGFEKAEITVGGIDVRDISSVNMESKLCPHLHFLGEVLDVSGQLGGFNLQWAWASGYACALSI